MNGGTRHANVFQHFWAILKVDILKAAWISFG